MCLLSSRFFLFSLATVEIALTTVKAGLLLAVRLVTRKLVLL